MYLTTLLQENLHLDFQDLSGETSENMTQIGIRQLPAAGRNFQDYWIEENFWL